MCEARIACESTAIRDIFAALAFVNWPALCRIAICCPDIHDMYLVRRALEGCASILGIATMRNLSPPAISILAKCLSSANFILAALWTCESGIALW